MAGTALLDVVAPIPAPATSRDTDGAQRLARDTLLRCWLRECGQPQPVDGEFLIDLPSSGVRLRVPVKRLSPTGWHRFGTPRLVPLPTRASQRRRASTTGVPVDAALLAMLLGRQAATRRGGGATPGAVDDLVARVIDSTHRIAAHLAAARERPDDQPAMTPFLANEQRLLVGHPFHPAPKSRAGLADAEAATFSPELHGSFSLHWFAADRTIVSSDSAWQTGAAELIAGLCASHGTAPHDVPPDTILVPAHPWQARELSYRPEIRELIDSGLLHDLGQSGPTWHPTSSVRTLYRPGCPIMLKLPLALPITNSLRENLRAELKRGVEMHRMLAGGLGRAVTVAHPRFRILTDPAWLAVDAGDANGCGLDVMIRQSPFRPCDEVSCLSALTDLGFGETGPSFPANRLAARVYALAAHRGEAPADAALAWFERYLRELILPVLWLDAEHGIALEAHQQNTLLTLDADGLPRAAWYRDNQGFYFRESRVEALARYTPEPGVESRTIVPDDLAAERLGYYLGINNLMGVIGALGHARVADETVLLRRTRAVLGEFATSRAAAGRPHDVTEALLDAPALRCKANLLTRVDGLDELVEPLATQSVYVDIPNPIAAA